MHSVSGLAPGSRLGALDGRPDDEDAGRDVDRWGDGVVPEAEAPEVACR